MSDQPPSPSPLGSSTFASSKKRKTGGRPEKDAWLSFDKIELPQAKAKSLGRNYDAQCKACSETIPGQPQHMYKHLAKCPGLQPSDQMAAMNKIADQGNVSTASTSANLPSSPMKKYLDKAPISKDGMMRLWLLLCLAFVMCGWSFRSVENQQFVNFLQNLRPKFTPPSMCLLISSQLNVLWHQIASIIIFAKLAPYLQAHTCCARLSWTSLLSRSKPSKASGCWMSMLHSI